MNPPTDDVGPSLPYCALNSLEVLEVGGGRATCATRVGRWLEGTPELGVPASVGSLADMVLMYAASTRSPRGWMPVTVGLRVDLWSSPPVVGTRLLGQARVEPVDGDVLLIRGEIRDGTTVVATATVRSMLVPLAIQVQSSTGPGRVATEDRAEPAGTSQGASPEVAAALALEASRLAGFELVGLHEGAVELTATPSGDLERTNGVLHGGAIPMLGSLASAVLLASSLPAGTTARRLDLTADYLRPTQIGSRLSIRTNVVHQSRRLLKTHTEIVSPDGKPTARIYETAVVDTA